MVDLLFGTHVDAPDTYDPAGAPNNTDHENITITHYRPDGNVQVPDVLLPYLRGATVIGS